LCVEFPQGYVLIHIGTGQVTDLFSISKTSPMPIVLPSKELLLAKDSILLFLFYSYFFYIFLIQSKQM